MNFTQRISSIAVISALAFLSSSCSKTQTQPAQPPAAPTVKNTVKTIALKSGDTLLKSLNDTGLAVQEANAIVGHLRTVFAPRYCRPGDNYEVVLDTAAQWVSFTYYPDGTDYYVVKKSTDGTVGVSTGKRPVTTTTVSAKGTLKTSLWEAMASQKIEPGIILDFTDIFAWQIDFLTDPRAGDEFKIVYEKSVTDDGTMVAGKILSARFVSSGQEHTAIRFTNSRGETDYYTADGRSMRSAFLKAPLQYRRISSFFTKKRYHPVLKYFRPHLGIDYAAPRGTPVSAVGAGKVIFAARKGGFGNLLQIRHPNGYVTYYGHLNGFARGVRAGASVRQGQLVAYVGSTGLSTGPHLDFRIQKNGTFINYLSLKFPAAKTIGQADAERFAQTKRDIDTQLAAVR